MENVKVPKIGVGDRVRVFDARRGIRGSKGIVQAIDWDAGLSVLTDAGQHLTIYPEQCRKLLPPPRKFWVGQPKSAEGYAMVSPVKSHAEPPPFLGGEGFEWIPVVEKRERRKPCKIKGVR